MKEKLTNALKKWADEYKKNFLEYPEIREFRISQLVTLANIAGECELNNLSTEIMSTIESLKSKG